MLKLFLIILLYFQNSLGINKFVIKLNNDLKKMNEWHYQWKWSLMLILTNKHEKLNKVIGLTRRFSVNLTCNALLIINEFFINLHLDYGDILHNKTNNEHLQNKMEKVQYQACLVITGVIQGTSREPVYDEHFFHIEWTNGMILNSRLGMLNQLKIYCNQKKRKLVNLCLWSTRFKTH